MHSKEALDPVHRRGLALAAVAILAALNLAVLPAAGGLWALQQRRRLPAARGLI